MRSRVIGLAALLALLPLVLRADGPAAAPGHVGLGLLMRKLATTGTVLHATAHPDDENNALLAMQSHGRGLRVVLATATRGNGGQNEIGPELFEPLGVLRTEELLAAHRFDGAEQFFTRAVDFGYSFSVDETFERWGRDEILGDFVRLIRLTRPEVIVTMRPDGAGGGQHHQASARIATDAFRAAADPARYPDQIAGGLAPWQPLKVYQARWYGMYERGAPPQDADLVPVDANDYDPLLGATYAEIGSRARAMHKCQGFGQLLALPGPFVVKYRLVDHALPTGPRPGEPALEDGIDMSIGGLAGFAGRAPTAALTTALADITRFVESAEAGLRGGGPDAAVPPLAGGLGATRRLRHWIAGGSGGMDATAAYEIDFRLQQTERKFEQALVLAQGLRIEVLAEHGVVVPGQQTKVSILLANRGRVPLRLERVKVSGFEGELPDCPSGEIVGGGVIRCAGSLTVPADARVTEPYWHREGDAGRYVFDADAPFGLPFRPTPFAAELVLTIGDVPVGVTQPVQHRYEGNIFSGEKRMELQVVPALSLRTTPSIVIVPAGGPAAQSAGGVRQDREVRVTVSNGTPEPAQADVRLELPPGWTASPPVQALTFARGHEDSTTRFQVRPPASVAPGEFSARAVATLTGARFDRGYQIIEYPHTSRRHIYEPAATPIKAIDVRLPERLTLGYVMGVGDLVPPALEQLGARVVMLGSDDLAWGDLSRFDAIVTGVRAYERRPDLRANNQRLLAYAGAGGTVVVQYNKFEFNQAQYGPYPAKVSADRVADERSVVRVLEPQHPVFTRPNLITPAAWEGWVQERGLYFLGERDPRYVDLVELEDSFELNPGPKRGALVEAPVGRGRWVYVGLGLWRQLPAGTDGAYRLLANIVSLGRTAVPASSAER